MSNYSQCCNAEIVYTDVCSVCKEHCDKEYKNAIENRVIRFGRKVFLKGCITGVTISIAIILIITTFYIIESF